jgi:hypothetical protein
MLCLRGITSCSTPHAMWWFNPVEIIRNELFAGASIALPSQVNDILYLLQLASNIMFGFFITGLVLDFVLMLLSPVVILSRWWSFPLTILAFVAALLVTAATIIGTALSVIFKIALTSQEDLNVGVDIGVKMLVFTWIATGFTVLAFLIHAGMGCCCASKRDIRTGRKGSRSPKHEKKSQKAGKRRFNLPRIRGRATAD